MGERNENLTILRNAKHAKITCRSEAEGGWGESAGAPATDARSHLINTCSGVFAGDFSAGRIGGEEQERRVFCPAPLLLLSHNPLRVCSLRRASDPAKISRRAICSYSEDGFRVRSPSFAMALLRQGLGGPASGKPSISPPIRKA